MSPEGADLLYPLTPEQWHFPVPVTSPPSTERSRVSRGKQQKQMCIAQLQQACPAPPAHHHRSPQQVPALGPSTLVQGAALGTSPCGWARQAGSHRPLYAATDSWQPRGKNSSMNCFSFCMVIQECLHPSDGKPSARHSCLAFFFKFDLMTLKVEGPVGVRC